MPTVNTFIRTNQEQVPVFRLPIDPRDAQRVDSKQVVKTATTG